MQPWLTFGVALVGDGVLVWVDALAVVADPYRPVFDDVGVAVGGVAHRGGLLFVHHDVDAGPGDAIGVTDDVAVPEWRGVGRDRLAVALDDDLVGLRVGQHDLVAADGRVAGGVGAAVVAAAEVQAVDV